MNAEHASVSRPPGNPGSFQLGPWRVEPEANRLVAGDAVRPLRHKAMELLVLLAERAPHLVTREELVLGLWQGNEYVATRAINSTIWAVRQALGDTADHPRYLQTVTKKGYRLLCLPEWPEPAPEAVSLPRRARRMWLAGETALLVMAGAVLAVNALPEREVVSASCTGTTVAQLNPQP